MKTLLLTGSIGKGKTRFVNRVAFECGLPLAGIRSARAYENGRHAGFDWLRYGARETRWPMVRFSDGTRLADGTFERAAEALEELRHEDGLLFVDEIGRFEKGNARFLDAAESVARDERPSILVLKKETLSLHANLTALVSRDVWFADLDELDPAAEEKLLRKCVSAWGRRKETGVRAARIILMASGLSRRFGEANKLLEDIGGKPMVQYAIDNIREYFRRRPDAGLAVCCAAEEEILRRAGDAGLIPENNPDNAEGISASIRLGLSVPFGTGGPETACFLTADQPALDADTLERFLERARRSPRGIFEARDSEGKGGNPVCYDRRYYGELGALSGDRGGRTVLKRHPEDIDGMAFTDLELSDVDCPADLAKVFRKE